MADTWFESLKKATVPATTPAPAKAALNVEPVFKDLCAISSDDGDVAVPTVTTKVFIDDTDDASIPSPVGEFFKKAEEERLRIPEITPPHEDGTFIEKCGSATWTHTYRNGVLTESVVRDPAMPGGGMTFDGSGNEVTKLRASWPGATRPIELFPTVHNGIPVRFDLDAIDNSFEELLGSAAYPESKQEVSADSKKTKAANSENFIFGGEVLAKGQIESRMLSVLAKIRSFCVGEEAKLIEKAARALDFLAFGELAEPVLERMKSATELVRS
jgi:hypothetical protein